MPTANINGLTIYYETYGNGSPVIFCYGLGGNTSEWAPQVAEFSKEYQFIIWDPRGHGRSDAPAGVEQYTLDKFASDLYGLLDHLQISKAFVGGLSMGGGVATRFTVLHPQKVSGLLIFNSGSASGLPVTRAARRMREEIIKLSETQGMDAVAQYSMRSNPNISRTANSGSAERQRILEMYRALSTHGYVNSTRMILNSEFGSELLAGITAPTLILSGDGDSALENCRYIHEQIKGSELIVLSDAGHLSNLDQPAEFNRAVLSFLNDIERG